MVNPPGKVNAGRKLLRSLHNTPLEAFSTSGEGLLQWTGLWRMESVMSIHEPSGPEPSGPEPSAGHSRAVRRWLAPAAVVGLMLLAYALGLHRYVSLASLAEHRTFLKTFTSEHGALALAAFVVIYVCAVALSLPGASLLTMAGGFLFGWLLGGSAAVVAATLGAIAIFLIARSSFGDALERRAGLAVQRVKQGFAADAFNYMLFLRLVPLFPFWLVNLAAALANVSLRAFTSATALGIIPGTFAFAFLGQGLDSVLAVEASWQACVATGAAASCPPEPSLSSLVTPQLLLAFSALGLVALLPVVLKRWKGRV